MILLLESSADVCSVGIEEEGKCIASKEIKGLSHAEKLAPLIDEILKTHALTTLDLEAVALSSGPGSYTGLRIGAALAKGICYAASLPLISVSTLHALFTAAHDDEHEFFIPMIDARRMEVYSGVFDQNHAWIRETKAEIIDENSFKSELEQGPVYFIGDGADKCEHIIKHKNAHFIRDIYPSTKNMAQIAYSNEDVFKCDLILKVAPPSVPIPGAVKRQAAISTSSFFPAT